MVLIVQVGTVFVGFYPSFGLNHLVSYRFETHNLPYILYPRDCPRSLAYEFRSYSTVASIL
jgi:hypothetical protein